MKKLFSLLLVAILLFCLSSCAISQKSKGKINIISSVFASYDFAKQLSAGVEDVEVDLLITPGTEPHSYEPSVQDMAKIKECDLFIYLGGESDEWVSSLLDTFEDDEVRTLKMIDCVELLEEETIEGMQSGHHEHHEDEHEHEHEAEGEIDEHVWTSPVNAISICEKIKDALCEIDNEHADAYNMNFKNYKAQLAELDGDFRSTFSTEQTLVIADRFPFRYLKEEYGFDYYAAFPGCSTENDPSAATIAFLENKIEELNSTAVFYTEFSSQKVADTLCEATGVKKLMLHSCHNVSLDDFNSGKTYVDLMKQNLKNIQEALK